MSWHHDELRKWIEANRNDKKFPYKNVYLIDPDQRREIDGIIKTYLWPAVLKGVEHSKIEITTPNERGFSLPIEDKMSPEGKRTFTFLFEDPRRPLSPLNRENNPPWFSRGEIECSLSHYMLTFDFILELPLSFDVQRILDLIGDSAFEGNPPELIVGRSAKGGQSLQITFQNGRGAGWGAQSFETITDFIQRRVAMNLQVIRAVERLCLDIDNDKLFKTLHRFLRMLYGEQEDM
jgi:hypothetical protein